MDRAADLLLEGELTVLQGDPARLALITARAAPARLLLQRMVVGAAVREETAVGRFARGLKRVAAPAGAANRGQKSQAQECLYRTKPRPRRPRSRIPREAGSGTANGL